MSNVNPWLLISLNCCGLPLAGVVVGYVLCLFVSRGYRLRVERPEKTI